MEAVPIHTLEVAFLAGIVAITSGALGGLFLLLRRARPTSEDTERGEFSVSNWQ